MVNKKTEVEGLHISKDPSNPYSNSMAPMTPSANRDGDAIRKLEKIHDRFEKYFTLEQQKNQMKSLPNPPP